MRGRTIRVVSRIIFVICGISAIITGVPYAMLRGIGLPSQSEWVIFAVALALVGTFSLVIAFARRAWIAKLCQKEPDDERLFSRPLKVLGRFALVSYLIAVFAYFAPHTWNLNDQSMLILCPLYLVKMTFDPSWAMVFFLLAPLNAGGRTARSASCWGTCGCGSQ